MESNTIKLFLFLFSPYVFATQYLGILTQKSKSEIRVCFLHDKRWVGLDLNSKKTLRKIPRAKDWFIIHNGKTLLKFKSYRSKSKSLSAIGLHNFKIKDPKLKKLPKYKSNGFRDWDEEHLYRPLVLSTEEYAKDPDNWKKAKLPKQIESQIKRKFIHSYPYIKNCKDQESPKYKINMHLANVIVDKAYKDKNDAYMIGVKYKHEYKCSGPIPSSFYTNYFYYKKRKMAKILDKIVFNGGHLTPLDVADYDNDGKSEWLFKFSAFTQDGYFLLNGLRVKKCTWGYH
jgi:hypothetical protein